MGPYLGTLGVNADVRVNTKVLYQAVLASIVDVPLESYLPKQPKAPFVIISFPYLIICFESVGGDGIVSLRSTVKALHRLVLITRASLGSPH